MNHHSKPMDQQNRNADGSAHETYDLIVIGSGIGALTAAAISAREGRRVILLEKQKALGGYATAFNRASMNFDVSLHQISSARHGRVRELFELAGVLDKVDFIFHDNLSEIIVNGLDKKLVIPNKSDPRSYIAELIKMFPEEKWAIRFWFWCMRRIGRQITYYDKARSKNILLQGSVVFFAPLFAPLMVFASLFPIKLAWVLRVKSPVLRSILLHFSNYFGLPAEEINMLFPLAGGYGYYYGGGAYVRGGSQTLSNALAHQIIDHNGVVRRGVEITQICLDGKRATGVEIKDPKSGKITTIKGKEILLSANPIKVVEDLFPKGQMRQKLLTKFKKMTPSMSCMVAYIKLSKPVAEINPELAHSYELTYLGPMAEKELYDVALKRDGFEGGYERYPLAMTFHSSIDPALSLSNPDKAALNLFYPDNYDRWAALSQQDYRSQKQAELEKVLHHLATYHPELIEHIEHAELGTPKTMERFTSNYKGAIYGFAQTCKQAGLRRFSGKTPIRNLFFVSAWTFPGGGYEGSLRAADMFVRRFGWPGKLVFLVLFLLSIFIPRSF